MEPGGVRRIQLRNGDVALVDAADFEWLNLFSWFRMPKGYAARSVTVDGKTRVVLMHREIAGTPKGLVTDHINGEKLDNRRANLRVCTQSENCCNSRLAVNNTSGFKGVSRLPDGSFQVTIKRHGKLYYVGRFMTAESGARAYDARALELHGEFSRLNFPEAA